MTILELKNIDKFYGSNHVVKNLSLHVEKGKFITVLGPSGCGKTTTLRMIAGFETPNSGAIELNGKDITALPPYYRNVNTVFQNYALFPNMTVEQNVAFGLQQKKLSKENISKKVAEMLEMVRMSSFAKRKPQELSGGQQQRVAIARAVANDPDILLLDEPLGALDLKLRKQMQFELKQLQQQLNKTFIYVTHDQEEALTMSDEIAVMNNGIIEQLSNANELYYKPTTKFVADFIGEINVLPCIVAENNSVNVLGKNISANTNNISKGSNAAVYLRPENIRFTTDSNAFKATVSQILFVGMFRKYKVDLGNNIFVTLAETTANVAPHNTGDEIFITWNNEQASVFE